MFYIGMYVSLLRDDIRSAVIILLSYNDSRIYKYEFFQSWQWNSLWLENKRITHESHTGLGRQRTQISVSVLPMTDSVT